MPRKRRVEYPGAVYHVISRGNYRKELFLEQKTGEAFEKALLETVERCGWKLHAYVVMSNHFHLAVETPNPNLVEGMKWLQSTFATRFNRFRDERGHVFQGRYKSILLSEDRPLLGLVDYIHLNPVRAGICSFAGLTDYKLSSYPKYLKRSVPAGLCRGDFLSILGLPDTPSGMRGYAKRLEFCAENDPEKREELDKRYCRGWFIGSKEEKKELGAKLEKLYPDADWEGVDLKELKQAKWESLSVRLLADAGKNESDIRKDAKGADWKARVARELRTRTTASNPWIARRLNMGHPSRISNLIRDSHKR